MDSRVAEFIRKHRADTRSDHFTHVSLITPKGRYTIGLNDRDDFFELYSSVLANSETEVADVVLGLAELPPTYSMMVADIDLKRVATDDELETMYLEKLYTVENVQAVVKAYQNAIKNVYTKYQPSHLLCVVLEKDPYIDEGYLKNGFHLAFINLFCNKTAQDMYLTPLVIKEVDDAGIFEHLGYNPSSMALDVPRKKNTRVGKPKPWLMYGSRKREDRQPYVATFAINENKIITLEKALSKYEIFDSKSIPIEKTEPIKYYFPRIFSVEPAGRETVEFSTKTRITNGMVLRPQGMDEENTNLRPDENQTLDEKISQATALLELLDSNRASDYERWMEIGWIIYCIGEGTQGALDLWISFSARCPEKFSEEGCIAQWSKMRPGNYTLGTLKYFASEDSPEGYEEYRIKRSHNHLTRAIHGSHHDLALALYEMVGMNFVCAALEPKPMWFQYINHHWKVIEKGITLQEKISGEVYMNYLKLRGEFLHAQANAELKGDSEKKEIYNSRINFLDKLLKSLKSTPFKRATMEQCTEVFYQEDFLRKVGKNPHLMAFKNGVYDTSDHIFRDGKPEDYIMLQMPIEYREFGSTDPWLIELDRYLEMVFPNPKIRDYWLDITSEMFIGGNPNKILPIYTGVGNNSKSILQKMLMDMFGEYAIDLPVTLLTGPKPKAGIACPELARAGNGVRVIFAQEPDHRAEMNIGTVKELSGGDKFFVRTLFSPGGEIDPQFVLILVCVSGKTQIMLSSGVSVSIEKLSAYTGNVIAWDETNQTFVSSKQLHFVDNGERECITLAFSSGRTITCTPEHKFMTANGEWIEAKDALNVSLKVGLDAPVADDLFEDHEYIWAVGMELNMNNQLHRLQASAICRLAGYNCNKYDLDNMLDICQALEDIKLVGTSSINVGKLSNEMFQPHFPLFLLREYVASVLVGAKINSKTTSFAFNDIVAHTLSMRFQIPIHIDKETITVSTELIKSIGVRYCNAKSSILRNNEECIVVDISPAGVEKVYDLSIETHHNFIANGVVVSNCNHMPRLPIDDPAMWIRLRVVPFEACFSDDAPDDETEQFKEKKFPIDRSFKYNKLPHLLEPLAFILLKRLKYNRTAMKVITEPSEVMAATEHYRKSNDVFAQYIEDKLVKDDTSSLRIMEIYTNFRDWYRNSFPNFSVPTKNEMQLQLERKWGKSALFTWKGWKFRNFQEELSADKGLVHITEAIRGSDWDKHTEEASEKSSVIVLCKKTNSVSKDKSTKPKIFKGTVTRAIVGGITLV